jgi:MoaA/NifB/PqqE/SkfB family radical SAM enzyme
MQNNKTFCILPFVHTAIHTNGDIKLCCYAKEPAHYNIKHDVLDDYWNSDYLTQVRQRMLNGKELSECINCYSIEQRGMTSLRQTSNQEYSIIQIKHASKLIDYLGYSTLHEPIDVEIQLTNLCNLKCIMCNESESSAILSENKLLNIAVYDQKTFNWNDEAINKIKQLFDTPNERLINIRGGEPFVIPQIFDILKSAVENDTAKNIKLHITTNCTKFNQKWVDILQEFKDVRIMLSLDATGALSEYIRFGSNWDTVVENINIMQTIKNAHFVVYATIQNISLLGLDKLITWCQRRKLFLQFGVVDLPSYFQLEVYPSKLHQQALDQLLTARDQLIDKKLVSDLDMLIEKLKNIESKYQTKAWDEFIKNIKMRESIRNNNIIDVIPELQEYIDV